MQPTNTIAPPLPTHLFPGTLPLRERVMDTKLSVAGCQWSAGLASGVWRRASAVFPLGDTESPSRQSKSLGSLTPEARRH